MHVLYASEVLAIELQLRPAGNLPGMLEVLEALRVWEAGDAAGVYETIQLRQNRRGCGIA